jgi:hypothetical protein
MVTYHGKSAPRHEKPTVSVHKKSSHKVHVKATTHPSLSNVKVKFYYTRNGGSQHKFGSSSTGSNGKASLNKTFHKKGTYKIYARVKGGSNSDYSNKHKVKIG